jgi:hypothetical protein
MGSVAERREGSTEDGRESKRETKREWSRGNVERNGVRGSVPPMQR